MQDLYDYAIRLETEGEKFFRDAAAGSAHEGPKFLFDMLAEAKAGYRRTYETMKQQIPLRATKKASANRAPGEPIFRKSGCVVPRGEIEIYRTAQELERKTAAFYRSKAGEVKGQPLERAFLRVAGEEEQHCILLDNFADFISQPANWLENAEWYHLEDY